ncbi:MAG: type II and III secretion system protein, partial [Planctomycetota bacterium]
SYVSGAHEPYGRGRFEGATSFADDTIGALEFGILNSHLNINAVLSMQTEILSATLLANPRVLVLDNETANFNIVREIPYEERSETAGSSGTLTTVQWKEVGVELCVTPHITRDGMIRLHILPEFGVVVGLVETGAPTVDTRKLETTTLVKDGQTVVLGGLRKKEFNSQINKVPFFGDLPLIGDLFKFEGEEEVISEIIVFITPRIFTEPVLFEDEGNKFEDTEFPSPAIPERKAERDKKK